MELPLHITVGPAAVTTGSAPTVSVAEKLPPKQPAADFGMMV